jgi:hypothetical protein
MDGRDGGRDDVGFFFFFLNPCFISFVPRAYGRNKLTMLFAFVLSKVNLIGGGVATRRRATRDKTSAERGIRKGIGPKPLHVVGVGCGPRNMSVVSGCGDDVVRMDARKD